MSSTVWLECRVRLWRQAVDPGEHEENQIKEQNTDCKSMNESEDSNDDKPVGKAELVNK